MMSNNQLSVPIIDVGPLFQEDSAAWGAVDEAIGDAAKNIGAFVATGMPEPYQVDDEMAQQLHKFFSLSQAMRDSVATQQKNPANNTYWRGYYATLKGGWAHNEFYDIGPETPVTGPDLKGINILTEGNVWPAEEPVPGWQAAMNAQYERMHTLSLLLFRSVTRALGADEAQTMTRFASGYSTLRLLNYPKKPDGIETGGEADAVRTHNGVEHNLLTMEHDDSCCLSLLWQDPKGGLQVQTPSEVWLDVPKVAGAVSVHFGDAAEPLTNNILRATPHRVLGEGGRQSMGFFFEPDLDAELSPLPGLPDSETNGTKVDTYASALLKVLVQRGMYVDMISVE